MFHSMTFLDDDGIMDHYRSNEFEHDFQKDTHFELESRLEIAITEAIQRAGAGSLKHVIHKLKFVF